MIDVHMIRLPNQNEEWYRLMMDSLEPQLDQIRLSFVDGSQFGPHIGRSRIHGFEQAQGEWVCYVDPDDWCAAGIFHELNEAVKQNPEVDVVYSRDMLVDKEGIPLSLGLSYGHAMAFRKSKLRYDLLEAAPHGGELWMKLLPNHIVLDKVGYFYRQYAGSPARTAHNYTTLIRDNSKELLAKIKKPSTRF